MITRTFQTPGMFFTSKIQPRDFVKLLVTEHQSIFGRDNLDSICQQFNVRFRDKTSYVEAFFEFQAYGLYSIILG